MIIIVNIAEDYDRRYVSFEVTQRAKHKGLVEIDDISHLIARILWLQWDRRVFLRNPMHEQSATARD